MRNFLLFRSKLLIKPILLFDKLFFQCKLKDKDDIFHKKIQK